MAETLGVRGYARHLGVSHTAVSKAIRSGRLTRSVRRDRDQRPRIDPDVADEEWEENTDQAQRREARAGGRPRRAQPGLFPGMDPAPSPRPDLPSFAQSRAIREAYNARLARLEYDRQAGNLVDAGEVRVQAFKLARSVRDALLAVPQRVAAELAAMTTPHAVRERLAAEIAGALEELARQGLEAPPRGGGDRAERD